MSLFYEKEKGCLPKCELLEQITGVIPQNLHMIILTDYELVEKESSISVFC